MKREAHDEKKDSVQNKRRANTAGQIIPRGDDNWLVRVFMGRDGSGKRRSLNKTVKGKKKVAQDYLNKTLTAISTGTYVEPWPLTVGEYLDKRLLTGARRRVTERTYVGYEWLLNTYVRSAIGEKRLSDLRPLDIQSLYTHMTSQKLKGDERPEPGVTYGLGLSARNVRYTHSVLSSALKQAVRWNMLTRNPCEAVELPRQAWREMLAFSPEEAARFLKAAEEDAYGTLSRSR